ncbi:MAG: hypothetical protein RLZZ347_274 [Candidatus Parcubacteria bacterium]
MGTSVTIFRLVTFVISAEWITKVACPLLDDIHQNPQSNTASGADCKALTDEYGHFRMSKKQDGQDHDADVRRVYPHFLRDSQPGWPRITISHDVGPVVCFLGMIFTDPTLTYGVASDDHQDYSQTRQDERDY